MSYGVSIVSVFTWTIIVEVHCTMHNNFPPNHHKILLKYLKTMLILSITTQMVHGTNMRPTWVLSAPDGPHVGPVNLAIRKPTFSIISSIRHASRFWVHSFDQFWGARSPSSQFGCFGGLRHSFLISHHCDVVMTWCTHWLIHTTQHSRVRTLSWVI